MAITKFPRQAIVNARQVKTNILPDAANPIRVSAAQWLKFLTQQLEMIAKFKNWHTMSIEFSDSKTALGYYAEWDQLKVLLSSPFAELF